jgi:hypothetical protein
LERYNSLARYALVVTISTDSEDVDLYTEVAAAAEVAAQTAVEV